MKLSLVFCHKDGKFTERRATKSKTVFVCKAALIFTVIVALLIGSCGCKDGNKAQIKDRYDYPSYLTSEYCVQNYYPLSSNYMYSKAYENKIRGDKQAFENLGGLWEFYAVYGEDVDEYIVGYHVLFPQYFSHETVLFRSNGNNSEPFFDYEISEIEIYAYYEGESSFEKAMDYEHSVTFFSLDKSSEFEIKNEIAQCVLNHHKDVHDVRNDTYDGSQKKNVFISLSEEGNIIECPLVLRVRFKETDCIFWQAAIINYKGEWYLLCESCNRGSFQLIELSDVLKKYIDNVFAEHPGVYIGDVIFRL